MPLTKYIQQCWLTLKTLNEGDNYERYLIHWRKHHADDSPPLDREAFFKQELERKWNGVNRCC